MTDPIRGRGPGGATNNPGDIGRTGTWTKWTLDSSGHWQFTQVDGHPPSGGHMAWGLDTAGNRVQHMVYPTGSSHRTTSTTTTTTTKAKVPTRPPYFRRERYFDAAANKWRWRWRYTPTNAELDARQAGLKHDSRGYFRVVNGHRLYVTGKTAGGRRFHYDWHSGHRQRVWDDPYAWPSEVAHRRSTLTKRRDELKSRLQSLRDQYSHSRADQHILRRNIVRRIKQIEASLHKTEAALKRLPQKNPFLLDFSKTKPKTRGGLLVTIDMAVAPNPPNSPLSFTNKLRVGRNVQVYIRATITQQNRDWKPGLLGAPEMVRVRWTRPRDWEVLDNLNADGTDEYLCSNPLYLVRLFRSPTSGDPSPSFSVLAQIYEYSFTSWTGAHNEGTD